MNKPIRVAVIDDYIVVREGVIALLKRSKGYKIIGQGGAGDELAAIVNKYDLDVIVVDLMMPAHADDPHGEPFEPVRSLKQIRDEHPELKIVVLTQGEDVQTVQSLAEIGVPGYVMKSDDITATLGNAIKVIARGGTYVSPEVQRVIEDAAPIHSSPNLTPRLRETLHVLIANCQLTRHEQAELLSISNHTLSKHIKSLQIRLNVPNIESLIVKAMRQNLLGVNDNGKASPSRANRFRNLP